MRMKAFWGLFRRVFIAFAASIGAIICTMCMSNAIVLLFAGDTSRLWVLVPCLPIASFCVALALSAIKE